eukprot:CAMPEP_0170605366 /NCGR_PEP_ID=MMETSP0224-20130122/19935_1 /TAXON_ID=285029 /ORGANISM="Togula jolla, Strain CCCM 725" /LENGTH=184 /DNA_ID=CAMNT_0010930365 /DNA_START=65 /DNA_END=615 /DNA_ORIENTATION=-
MRSRAPAAACLFLAAYGAVVFFASPAFVAPDGSALGRRSAVLNGAAGTAVALLGAEAAMADAQGEPARALARWGPAILSLESSINSGDMKAVLKKENKFKLLNSYWRNSPLEFEKQTQLSEDLLEAAFEGKKDDVKKLYNQYVSNKAIQVIKSYPPGPTRHIINTATSIYGDMRSNGKTTGGLV